ncbi:hypothetical protein CIK78_14625 [Halomonas sp. JB37]|nr:hypothetical protein CIK78_14625 [Halomonas sp. JB37]
MLALKSQALLMLKSALIAWPNSLMPLAEKDDGLCCLAVAMAVALTGERRALRGDRVKGVSR